MHIHVVGIGGTLMAGIALIAKQAGFTVTGSDQAIFPPMSIQLEEQGIVVTEGYDFPDFPQLPDYFVVGNAARRGMPIVETLLSKGYPLVSGPAWLAEHVLPSKTVIAVAGTHGKTTTSSIIAWLLTYAGLSPGWLIGGIPNNLAVSARWTDSSYFVIEADEYDTAFFDKRAKMIHYRPQLAVLNNLEFDHADIYLTLQDMQRQYANWLKTLPPQGLLCVPEDSTSIDDVLAQGVWTTVARIGSNHGLHATLSADDPHCFELFEGQSSLAQINWPLMGRHNMQNALMAVAVAMALDIDTAVIVEGLQKFKGVRRRLDYRGQQRGLTVIEDFAHHPTAIAATTSSYRARLGEQQSLYAVIDFASNTMKAAAYPLDHIIGSVSAADRVWFLNPPSDYQHALPAKIDCSFCQQQLAETILSAARPAHVLVMSNKDVSALIDRLLNNGDG